MPSTFSFGSQKDFLQKKQEDISTSRMLVNVLGGFGLSGILFGSLSAYLGLQS